MVSRSGSALRVESWAKAARLTGVAVLVSLASPACGGGTYVWFDQLPPATAEARLNLIKPADKIGVFVDQHTDLSGQYDISSSGDYSQPLAGNIMLAGQSPDQAAETIRVHLSRFVQAPVVRVTIILPGPNRLTVLGEVNKVGPLSLTYDQGLLGAIASAGGFTPFADKDSIFIVRSRPQALRIRFRYDDLIAPNPRATNFPLQDGDVIIVE